MIIDSIAPAVIWLGTISIGIMGGVYFTFSAFVMRSLDKLPAADAISAMNSINRVILGSAFMPVFFGSSLLAIALVALGIGLLDGAPWYLAAAGLIFFIGMPVVTVVRSVPLNDRLAAFEAKTGDAVETWRSYLRQWSQWNHVRTVSSILSLGLLSDQRGQSRLIQFQSTLTPLICQSGITMPGFPAPNEGVRCDNIRRIIIYKDFQRSCTSKRANWRSSCMRISPTPPTWCSRTSISPINGFGIRSTVSGSISRATRGRCSNSVATR